MKNSYQKASSRASFAGLLLAASASAAFAQTSGSLNTPTSTNYSTAPWNITGGTGTYPDGGGTAEFDSELNTVVGTVAGSNTITLDVTPTLGGVVVNDSFFETLAASGTNTLNLASTGATFNLTTAVSSPNVTSFGFSVTAPISGGGTSGLTTTGTGALYLSGTNTFTGGVHVGAGTTLVATTDAAFGATGAGNDLNINGGTLVNYDSVGLTTARNLNLGSGGASLLLFYAMTDTGVVGGTGSLNINNAVLTLTGTNTFTGATNITSVFAGLTLNGTGTTNTSTGYDLSGTVTLDSSGTNNSDRLSNTAPITSRGATIALTGNAAAATNEVAGALTLAGGVTTLAVTPNAAQAASLSFSGIARQNAGTMFVHATSLGAAAGNGVGEIISVASPGTLVGGGGAAGSQNISILPYAIGNTSATATASSSFVTWDPATSQFRPLATTEYSTLASAENDANNTVVTAATAIAAATTVNSVKITGTGTLLSGTGGLTITSGDLLYSPTGTTAGTVSATLNFGAAEGIISTTAGASNSTTAALTLSGIISGTGGLTLNPVIGEDIRLTGANTYTGTTTFLGGLTQLSGTVASDGVTAGPLGLSTTPVVLSPTAKTFLNGIYAPAALTFNRPLNVAGGTNNQNNFLVLGAGYGITLNGAVNLAAGTNLDGYDTGTGTAANGIIYNNVISGGGGLTDNTAGTFTVLNAANTYSGGTNTYLGTYVVGADSVTSGGNTVSGAFGTGPIYFSSTAKITASAAHTVSNPIVMTSGTSAFTGTGALTFTGPVNLDGQQTLTASNTAGITFSGVLSNGSLTKAGTGPLSLGSPTGNTYTGGTVLGGNVGALLVNNTSGSGTGTGTVSIGATSATTFSALAGNFTIAGATSIAGRLSPGNSGLTAMSAGVGAIGIDTFTTTLTLSAGTTSSLLLEVDGANSFDQINVGGLLTLNGTVTVATIGGYTVQAGDTFKFLTFGTIADGTFTFNTGGVMLAPGVTLDTSTFGVDGTIRAVPEPGTSALFAVGSALAVAGFVLRRCTRPQVG